MSQPLMIYEIKIPHDDSMTFARSVGAYLDYDLAKQAAERYLEHDPKVTAIIIDEYQKTQGNCYKPVSRWSCREDDAMRWEWSAI